MTTFKSIRNLSACVEKSGRNGMGGWLQFGRGELGWEEGEEEREIEEERVGRVGIYWLLPMESPTKHSVGKSAGECATSLYGDPSLNPSVIPSVKSSEKNPHHHTVATFQKSI